MKFPKINIKNKTTKFRLKAAMDKMHQGNLLESKYNPDSREEAELHKARNCIQQIMESECDSTLDKKFLLLLKKDIQS